MTESIPPGYGMPELPCPACWPHDNSDCTCSLCAGTGLIRVPDNYPVIYRPVSEQGGRYNHAFTLAYDVLSDDSAGATLDQHLDAVFSRLRTLIADPGEAGDALLTSLPYDTYEVD